VEVALPRLDVIVGVVSKASQVGRHRSVVLHQRAEQRCIASQVLIEIMPFVKLYLLAFSSGKESTRALGNYDSVTVTAGELWMCFLESISSCIKVEVLRRKSCRAVAQIDPRSPGRSRP
jgi:hypothetical protein